MSIEFGNQCRKLFIRALHCIQVVYQVQLENGVAVMVMLYLVYARPSIQHCQTDILPQQRSQADMQDEIPAGTAVASGHKKWVPLYVI